MFERRLKLFFLVLVGMTGLLAMRAAQLQVWGADDWRRRAEAGLTKRQLLETTRGSILDVFDRTLAVDEPCMDAVVDFRAIQEDPGWISEVALRRLTKSPEQLYRRASRERRKEMLDGAQEQVRADLKEMWRSLARETGKSIDEIEEIKSSIRRKVLMRQRLIWYHRYAQAMKSSEETEESAWYKRWLLSGAADPQIDSFSIEVSEQTEHHVVAANISNDAHNALKKEMERFPGLDVRPGLRRYYPFGASAAHVIGTMSPVGREKVERDITAENELRKYYLNDRMGATGVEAMAEETLRGARGQIIRIDGQEQTDESVAPKAGKDVHVTLDIMLQAEIEQAFKRVEFKRINKETRQEELIDAPEMYGAAVVIDVATGAVRAMVSNPSFDPNELDEKAAALAKDRLNRPLTNRATQMTLVPGSTVKPIVGIGAIMSGHFAPADTIECRGYLYIDGKKLQHGRCWTVAMALKNGADPEHHKIPWNYEHDTGHLLLSDALQRSCNVFFETLGDRMKLEGLSVWYEKFGLGQRTEIGIAESDGMVPVEFNGPDSQRRWASWSAAIGQGPVQATPLQMANVAATIARDGVWMRPKLVEHARIHAPRASASGKPMRPDREDLRISPEALRLVKEGMFKVVNTRAGTGHQAASEWLKFAGKTGSAQTARFMWVPTGGDNKPLKNEKGELVREMLEVGMPGRPNREHPWHRTSSEEGKMSHGWFIGYAPAENPKVAFAVMMEYGGGGGETAPIVKALLEACSVHGYLSDRAGAR